MATPSSDTELMPPDENTTGQKASWRPWVAGAVLAGLILVCGVPVFLTATPGQCASCHEMKPYYDSWASSSHRAAAPSCLYCHARPGILNLAIYEVSFYREIIGHFTGAEVTTTGANAPSADSCQRDACHSLNREASYSGDLKINHRLHARDEGIACSECHPGAVHEGVESRAKLPPVKLCWQCHSDEMDDCSYCHAGKVAPDAPGSH